MTYNASRRGPWDTKLEEFNTSKRIVVIIHNLTKNEVEREVHLDYGAYEDRKLLGRITFWAVQNRRSVETIALEDWEKENGK